MLLSLPPELLDYLLSQECLSLRDLHALARVCRHLNSVAIISYFKLIAATDSSAVTVDLGRSLRPHCMENIDNDWCLLKGWGVSLDRVGSRVRTLEVHLKPYDILCPSKAASLTRTIKRLAEVEEAFFFLGLDLPPEGKVGGLDIYAQLHDWSEGLFELMEAVVQTGCKRLEVCHLGKELKPAPKPAKRFQKSLKWGKAFLRRVGKRTDANADLASLCGPEWVNAMPAGSRKIPPVTTSNLSHSLEELRILAPHFLVPPYLPWLLSVARSRPIHTLHITDFAFHIEVWPYVLPTLWDALGASLTNLTLAKCHTRLQEETTLTAHDIFESLGVLNQLEYLSIDHTFGDLEWTFVRLPQDALPIPLLPHLLRLKAPPFWASRLLQTPLERGAPQWKSASPTILPMVKDIIITASINDCDWDIHSVQETANVWNSFLDRACSVPRSRTPSFKLDFHSNTWDMDQIRDDLYAFNAKVAALPVKQRPVLRHISSVRLERYQNATPADIEAMLHSMVTHYPDLQEIWMCSPDPQADTPSSDTFKRVCPGVRKLVTNRCQPGQAGSREYSSCKFE